MLHLVNLLSRRSPTVLERHCQKDLEVDHWTSLACDYSREFHTCFSTLIEQVYPSEKKFVLDDVLVGWLEEHPDYAESVLVSLIKSLKSSKKMYNKRLAPFYCMLIRMQEPLVTRGWTETVIRMLKFLVDEKITIDHKLRPLARDLVNSASIPMTMNLLEHMNPLENSVFRLYDQGSMTWRCSVFVYSLFEPDAFSNDMLSKILGTHHEIHGDYCSETLRVFSERRNFKLQTLLTYLDRLRQLLHEPVDPKLWLILECILPLFFAIMDLRDSQDIILFLKNQYEARSFSLEHLNTILQKLPKTRREALLKEMTYA